MYRDIIKNSQSLHRLMLAVPCTLLISIIGRWKPSVFQEEGIAGVGCNIPLDDDLTFGVLVCAGSMHLYQDARRRRVQVSAVRYEDLVANPTESCRRIIEYCGLPDELVDLAVRAFNVDSQRNTRLSRQSMRKYKEPAMRQETRNMLNERVLGKLGLPLIGEDCLLDGTITCFK